MKKPEKKSYKIITHTDDAIHFDIGEAGDSKQTPLIVDGVTFVINDVSFADIENEEFTENSSINVDYTVIGETQPKDIDEFEQKLGNVVVQILDDYVKKELDSAS